MDQSFFSVKGQGQAPVIHAGVHDKAVVFAPEQEKHNDQSSDPPDRLDYQEEMGPSFTLSSEA